MNLEKTDTLSGDPAQNDSKFRELLEKDSVLFVVQGSGQKSESLVEMADGLAGAPTDLRWVVWAKNPNDIANAVSGLSCSVEPAPSGNDQGFTISLTKTIRDVIRADEPEPDELRVFDAYAIAEEDK